MAHRDDCGSWENFQPQELRPDRLEQSPCDSRGIESGEIKERQGWSAEAMADTGHLLARGWSESTGATHSNASNGGEAVGHAIKQGVEGAYDNRKSSERIQPDTVQSDPSIWPSCPSERQYYWEPPRVCETQPPLGGNPDGPAGGLDYAELCITCDNRTDELRLLGNGVVPATAELAYRTLMRELLQNSV